MTIRPRGRQSDPYTEADWNTNSTLERIPFYFSKTLAEREAWSFVDREKPCFARHSPS
jgi:dihydroflavonol-4-reductase